MNKTLFISLVLVVSIISCKKNVTQIIPASGSSDTLTTFAYEADGRLVNIDGPNGAIVPVWGSRMIYTSAYKSYQLQANKGGDSFQIFIFPFEFIEGKSIVYDKNYGHNGSIISSGYAPGYHVGFLGSGDPKGDFIITFTKITPTTVDGNFSGSAYIPLGNRLPVKNGTFRNVKIVRQ